jgi:hypothetical protein
MMIKRTELTAEDRLECLRLLIALMPVHAMDTLFVLLQFLNAVASSAQDKIDDNGVLVE